MKNPLPSRTFRFPLQRALAFVLVLIALHSQEASHAADAPAQHLETGPIHFRCLWTTDPATSATLSWSTRAPGARHEVRLRVADGAGAGNGSAKDAKESDSWTVVPAQRNARFSAAEPKLYYHHCHVDGLKPGTDYQVTFTSDETASPVLKFRTAPNVDVPVTVLFGADSRSGLSERREVNAMISRMLAESYIADRSPISAFAHGGDYIADGNRLDQWDQWLTDYESTVADGRLLPLIPARGNHDVGKLYNEIFAFPEDDRNYYAINIGPQLHWITLNTETSVAGEQTSWLAADLATARPHHRWVAAQYHRPAFAAVKLPFRALAYWTPLFEKFNVDLVCEGDGHCIKRTAPVRKNKIDSTGVVYIGEGGLGVGQRTPKSDRWFLREPHAKTGAGHHVQLLTFGPDVLHYRVVLLGGEVFDDHRIQVRP